MSDPTTRAVITIGLTVGVVWLGVAWALIRRLSSETAGERATRLALVGRSRQEPPPPSAELRGRLLAQRRRRSPGSLLQSIADGNKAAAQPAGEDSGHLSLSEPDNAGALSPAVDLRGALDL